MANYDIFVHVEVDQWGILVTSNDLAIINAAARLVRSHRRQVASIEKCPDIRQLFHPVDRSDPIISESKHQFRVTVKFETNTLNYAQRLVIVLNKKLNCLVEFKEMG